MATVTKQALQKSQVVIVLVHLSGLKKLLRWYQVISDENSKKSYFQVEYRCE